MRLPDETRGQIARNGSYRTDGKIDSDIHRVLTASHQIAEHLNATCEAAGVSLPLARALQFLAAADGPITPTQLSRELGRSPASTSELVKRLVNAAHINADVDPHDRRSFKLTLTRAGHARWKQVRPAIESVETAIERGYGKRRLAQLVGSVDDLVATIQS